MARLVLDHVSKEFPVSGGRVQAVTDFTLQIEEGELVTLVGPSGCGKTTTLRLIAGLEQPTRGTISIDGRIVTGVAPRNRDVAMVFQHDTLYPHMTACENMAFGLKLRGHDKAEIRRRVRAMGDVLGLTHLLDRLPETLSGGERARIALGRAIVRRPKALLLDEPFANLDAPMRAQMRLELKRLHQHIRTTMVHVTHDQVEALTLGNRVVVMNRGAIQQVASPLALYEAPANVFVAGFIGCPPMNLAQGSVGSEGRQCVFKIARSHGADAGIGLVLTIPEPASLALSAHVGRTLLMGLRPEDIEPALGGAPEDRRAELEAVVELVELAWPDLHLHLDVAGWRCVARWPRLPLPNAGDKVLARAVMRRARFFDPETGCAIA